MYIPIISNELITNLKGKVVFIYYIYSRTPVARTPMARLPWIIGTSFLGPYEILPIAQGNKYLGKFSYFIMKLYVMCTHDEAILMNTHNIPLLWLELPLSRINFHGSNDARAIEVLL